MRIAESNEFVYRKWFGINGFEQFKKDIVSFPSTNYILDKINTECPFSPDNFKWAIKPPPLRVPENYKPRNSYGCYTLNFTIEENSLQHLLKSGVYKVTFNNGCFYIGSTSILRKRVSHFVAYFNGTSRMHNKKMIQCVVDCTSAVFEVLESGVDINKLREIENTFIQNNVDNPLLINRAHDAFSNKGIKWTDEEKKKAKDTLLKKYLAGQTNGKYNWAKTKKPLTELFKSKCFGDKED